MRILIVKLTSMGDVLHVLPALTDLHKHHPEAVIDWMVEDSFSNIPTWHPAVNQVLKVSTRRWRKLDRDSRREYRQFKQKLRETAYDIVIDAQGLIKSAWIARKARLTSNGKLVGFSGKSIKESPAAWLYHQTVDVERQQHAVTRLRQLFAGVWGYQVDADDANWPDSNIDYGLALPQSEIDKQNTIMLFHGTTWSTKHLPDQLWRELSDVINQAGFQVTLCWGNETERQRAEWIAQGRDQVEVLPKSSLTQVAIELQSARGAIAVDTGLGHLAAALGVPCVSVYGATNPKLTGAVGQNQRHLTSRYDCAPCLSKQCQRLNAEIKLPPCYDEFSAFKIWQNLAEKIPN